VNKYTVFGAKGFIGQKMVKALRSKGYEVWEPNRIDSDIYRRPLGHVIYAAGVTADFRSRPFDTVEAHVCFLSNILKEAQFESLIYLSSTRLYSGVSKGSEDTVLHVQSQDPSDLYNLSKLMGESLCLASGCRNVKIVRLSNVLGGGDDNFITSLYREAKSGQIILRTALSSKKDYIHIDDVTDLLAIIIEGRHSIYNIASGQQVMNAQWIEYFVKLTGCKANVEEGAPEISFVAIDISRIRDEFNFTPRCIFDGLSWNEN